MSNYNSPQESTTDPLVMYFVVRKSLNMSLGKVVSQCAHAAQMLTLEYANLRSQMYVNHGRCDESARNKINLFELWMETDFRKVVLQANEEDWDSLKNELKNNIVLIKYAGYTEVPSGSETVIGLFPMYKSSRTKTLKKLQTLK
jgi:peptidyl-tRNA hydrolase